MGVLSNVKIVQTEKFPACTHIFVNDEEIHNVASYKLSQYPGEVPILELNLNCYSDSVTFPMDIRIGNYREIARCMSRNDFEYFKNVWNEVHSEDEENE